MRSPLAAASHLIAKERLPHLTPAPYNQLTRLPKFLVHKRSSPVVFSSSTVSIHRITTIISSLHQFPFKYYFQSHPNPKTLIINFKMPEPAAQSGPNSPSSSQGHRYSFSFLSSS